MRLLQAQSKLRELEEENKSLRSSSGASFASRESASSAPPQASQQLKSGNLMKKSKYLRSYARRFVQLDILGLFSWDGGSGHRGFVNLAKGSFVSADGEGKSDSFPFFVVHEGKKIELAATSENARREWIAAIEAFIEKELTHGR